MSLHISNSPSSESEWSDIGIPRNEQYNAQHIVSDAAYAAKLPSSSTESPLSEQQEPIAVVGMGCRLPGDVRSSSDLWRLMMEKRTGQTPKVPSSRFNIDAHFHPSNERPGSFNAYGGYFLNQTLQEFDPGFFDITPVEAMWMDPQQRLLLEVVYETFESAGLTLDQLSGSDTACFMASFTSDFQQMSFKEPHFRHNIAALGVDPGIISNRISNVFNLQGPSIVVNTACSSSFYALHNACNALRNRDCSGAVVGGVNLILTVDQHMNTAKLGVLSPTSTCHTFNEHADGYGRAEGVGAVYLKRLSDAVRDGDVVRGIIRSSATNNNGKQQGLGITYPGFDGQVKAIQKAYAHGKLDPSLTGYFEVHGTGTAIGDPLEVHAVAQAMTAQRSKEETLLIGALKTNIGHSEAASGLSALIKAILTVEKGIIPPTRGVTKLNPSIAWDSWNVQVVQDPTIFPTHLPIRRVSANSFGYGGTNAHIVVESADSLLANPQTYKCSASPQIKRLRSSPESKRPHLLLLSAHDTPTLKRNIAALSSVADQYDMLDLSYTLACRRTRFGNRAMVVASQEDVSDALSQSQARLVFAANKKKARSLGFVFTGQGAQWPRMGAELIERYPSVLRSIRKLDAVLHTLHDRPTWTIEDLLLEDATTSRINEAEIAQPLCTAIQIALVQLLRDWGIEPTVTCGHSSGELAAAYTAGLISAGECIVLAYYRGQVVRDINTSGAMLAVGLGAEDVSPYIKKYTDQVVIACHNSPSSVTLSGDLDALEEVRESLAKADVFARLLKTGGKAYHSHHMAPACARYESQVLAARQAISNYDREPSKANMISTVSNTVLPGGVVLDEKYWSANLLSPVLFNQAIQTLGKSKEFADVDILIEIGPHAALSGPLKQIREDYDSKFEVLPSLIRGEDSSVSMLRLAGELYLRNSPTQLDRITAIEETDAGGTITHRKGDVIVDLPPYQWDQTKRYWAECRESKNHRQPRFSRHDLLGSLLIGCSPATPIWRNVLRISDLPWLKDHSLGGEAVFPAAGYFSMAIEALTQISEIAGSPSIEGYTLKDVDIMKAMVIPEDDTGVEVMLTMQLLQPSGSDAKTNLWSFIVASVSSDGETKDHMRGSICINERLERPLANEPPRLPQRSSGEAWYQALRDVGFYYGPTFNDMKNIAFDGKTYAATCDTRIKTTVPGMVSESRFVLHPASIDTTLQLLIVSHVAGRTSAMGAGAVIQGCEELEIWRPTEAELNDGWGTAYSWIDPRGARTFIGHNQLVACDGQVVMQFRNMKCSLYEAAVPQKIDEPVAPQPYSEIVWKRDVDSISNAEYIKLSMYIELLHFKHPGLRVLTTDTELIEDTLTTIPDLSVMIACTTEEDANSARPRFQGKKNVQIKLLDVGDDNDGEDSLTGVHDLVLVPNFSAKSMDKLSASLSPSGRIITKASDACKKEAITSAGLSVVGPNLHFLNDKFIVLSKIFDLSTSSSTKDFSDETIQLVYRRNPPKFLHELKLRLEISGFHVTTHDVETPSHTAAHAVMLADFETPLLPTITEAEFVGLQKVVANTRTLSWFTAGGHLHSQYPGYAMASGLIRSLTSEQASLHAVLCDLDEAASSAKDVAERMVEVVRRHILAPQTLENEYCIQGRDTYISRLEPHARLNDTENSEKKEPEKVTFDPEQPIVAQSRSGAIVFEADLRAGTALHPEEVEVQVLTTSLSIETEEVLSGSRTHTDLSDEIGGIVRRVGSAVRTFTAGDRVVGFSFDKFASFQRVKPHMLQRLEPRESLAEMTSLPIAYSTALHGLKVLANAQPGERVLILCEDGPIAGAAVKVTQALGGVPQVVVHEASQVETFQTRLGLSASQVVPLSQLSHLKHSDGRFHYDVVFCASHTSLSDAKTIWRHVAPHCRFVNCGPQEISSQVVQDALPLSRGANYLAFDLYELYHAKPQILSRALELALSLYRLQGGAAWPIVRRHITDLHESVKGLKEDMYGAQVIIDYEESTGTLDMLPSLPRVKLSPDVTYLLVGCLGGLGRSLTSWMLERGAKHFCFLSRSGADSEEASTLVQELLTAGAIVTVVKGDVGVKSDVESALASIPPQYPLRGIIHAAMVLRDTLFENMPFPSWQLSTHAKVIGASNLHTCTQHLPLDFFILTSSVSGVLGTPGQTNYAAGNAYLDALARHRRSRGLKAVSLVLPMVLGVGVVAGNDDIEDGLRRMGMYGVDEEALVRGVEVGILEQQDVNYDEESVSLAQTTKPTDHIILGLDPSQLLKAQKDARNNNGNEAEESPFWASDPRFAHLLHSMSTASTTSPASTTGSGSKSPPILTTLLLPSTSPHHALSLIRTHLTTKLSRMLLLDMSIFKEDEEEDTRSLESYGVNSMLGAELRTWIFREFGLDVSFQALTGRGMTVGKFAGMVCGKLGITEKGELGG